MSKHLNKSEQCRKIELVKKKNPGAVDLLRNMFMNMISSDVEAGEEGINRAPIALHFHELTLRVSDIHILQGSRNLNERLLSFYFAYLQQNRYKNSGLEVFFLPPNLSQNIRYMKSPEIRKVLTHLGLIDKPFIFMALSNTTNQHWSMMLLSRPDNRFYYYDSSDNHNLSESRQFFDQLRKPLNASQSVFTVGRCLQQLNNNDSGVHVLCMTDHLADYVVRCGYATASLLIAIQHVREMRSTLLQLIQTLGGIVSPNLRSVRSRHL